MYVYMRMYVYTIQIHTLPFNPQVPKELEATFDLTMKRPLHAVYGDQHNPPVQKTAVHVRF